MSLLNVGNIQFEGSSEEHDFLSIEIVKEVNRIPHAELVLRDGNIRQESSTNSAKFMLSNSSHFAPGSIITLKLSDKQEIFKGVVIKHKIEESNEGARLTVALKDPAFKLTRGRKSKVHQSTKAEGSTDQEIIHDIIETVEGVSGSENASLTVNMEKTTVKYQELVQYYCTDWDFILSRADINGQIVCTNNGHLTIKKPTTKGAAKDDASDTIAEFYELELEVDVSEQYGTIKSYAWNIGEQAVEKSEAAVSESQANESNNSGIDEETAKNIGAKQYMLSSMVNMSEQELKTWADAKKTKESLSLLKGKVVLEGRNVNPGDIINIAQIANRFDGEAIVTAVRHNIDSYGWKTHIQFGLSADWFAQQNKDIIDMPAAGLLPAIQGLQIGIVQDYEPDPQKQFQVKVKMPALNPEGEGEKGIIWARLLATDAGKDRGVYFYPEPKDEVVVGFFNNDPRQAVILGAMHSASKPPPLGTTKSNKEKGIVTKGGSMLVFHDDKQDKNMLKLGNTAKIGQTNMLIDQQVILIDQGKKTITIDDKINNNKMVLGTQGIQISCDKDIKIEAAGNVIIKGKTVDVN